MSAPGRLAEWGHNIIGSYVSRLGLARIDQEVEHAVSKLGDLRVCMGPPPQTYIASRRTRSALV